jgi:thioredoxin reductase (NADPH)
MNLGDAGAHVTMVVRGDRLGKTMSAYLVDRIQAHPLIAADNGVRTDAAGFILTGLDLLEDGRRPDDWPLTRDPLPMEMSVPGLFAAGDVRHGSTKRVAGAVGDGAMAVALAHRRLAELQQERSA